VMSVGSATLVTMVGLGTGVGKVGLFPSQPYRPKATSSKAVVVNT